ncbi:hypothetical protein ACTG0T_14830 [Halococcus morrhuae DSM 1307]|uniref:hypothetical protein n=1 Tax=Halococcus morrhuae TaxID=2250 RepID=UPI003F861B5C
MVDWELIAVMSPMLLIPVIILRWCWLVPSVWRGDKETVSLPTGPGYKISVNARNYPTFVAFGCLLFHDCSNLDYIAGIRIRSSPFARAILRTGGAFGCFSDGINTDNQCIQPPEIHDTASSSGRVRLVDEMVA